MLQEQSSLDNLVRNSRGDVSHSSFGGQESFGDTDEDDDSYRCSFLLEVESQ